MMGGTRIGSIRSIEELEGSAQNHTVFLKISTVKRGIDVGRQDDELLGGLGTIVYITGLPRPGFFMELGEDYWRYGVDLLVMCAVWIIWRSLEYLVESDNPIIAHLTSIAVRETIPDVAFSNTSRIAVHGIVKTPAGELGLKGIGVNAILPGHIIY